MAEENPNLDDQEVPDEVAAMFDLKQKKKKKKVTTKKADAADGIEGVNENEVAPTGSSSEGATSATAVGVSDIDPPQYTYSQLLNRVVDFLHANNPDLIEKRRYTMKPPQLMRGRHRFVCWGPMLQSDVVYLNAHSRIRYSHTYSPSFMNP